ncbi:hypothetical protein Tco_1008590 [Tanacetum coccineum]
MVDANKDDETPPEGSTIALEKKLKESLKVDKLTKEEFKRIKRDGFNLIKNKFKSSMEFEYYLEQVALAISKEFDWANLKENTNSTTYFYVDFTKPLPMQGHPHNVSIATSYFFNNELEYLIHGNTYENKYALSITKYPTSIYTQDDIKESITNYGLSVAEYNQDAELGIHPWPQMRKLFYESKLAYGSRYDVYHESKTIAIVRSNESLIRGSGRLKRCKIE